MAGPYLWPKEEVGPAVKGAWETTVSQPWSPLVPRNSPVARRNTLPYEQGFRVRTGQGMGFV